MYDSKYCYPGTNVLKNEFGIKDSLKLFELEKKLTSVRLQYLQDNPLKGEFDFSHLKAIHQYIFQDLYEWAGEERTVEIGKGNLFCTTAYLQEYAHSVFDKYFRQCYQSKDSKNDFIKALADNYGDLNALHPFRDGNGRAQREFARLVCMECGYDFDLSATTHEEMLEASILSFNKGDSSGFIKIFLKAVTALEETELRELSHDRLNVLTSNDLILDISKDSIPYGYEEYSDDQGYDKIYKAKIKKMDAEKEMNDTLETALDTETERTENKTS